MTKELLKLTLEAIELHLLHHEHGCVYLDPVVFKIKDALQEPVAWMVYTQEGQSAFVTDNPAHIHPSQRALPLYTTPPQPAQKPVAWLEPEWGEKICPEVGYEVTMTDDHPRDLGWIPLYAHRPQGEIVAYLVLFEGAGKLLEFTKGNYIHGAKVEHVPLYTAPPQRPWVLQREWVDLTDEEIDKWAHELHGVIYAVMAELKEKNNG